MAERAATHRIGVAAPLVLAVAAVLGVAMAGIPRDDAPLPAIARYALNIALPSWNLTEPVNEIVYGTRAFDTFGETFLLLAAVICVVVLARTKEPRSGYLGEHEVGEREQREFDPAERSTAEERRTRRAERREEGYRPGRGPATPDREPLGSPAPELAQGMTVVVRGGVRFVLPVLAVAGLYLVALGYAPGGGFPAGAVVLGVVLLAYAAFGYARIRGVVRQSVLEVVELAGAAVIIATELLGLVLRGSFTANWLPLTAPETIRGGGVVQLFSAAELVEVATGLVIVVFALLGMRHDWAPDRDEEDA
ncbi:MnhB domain-containing protein [Pseudonocardia acaciae]|uniref:MnhB domain-containing protein n=1 Tax=Pseudonocardia acaciae TaxID=551276 RepID=UPI00048BB508|nr:MnhB domain-containing protein [Pseudonocardia acaciae]